MLFPAYFLLKYYSFLSVFWRECKVVNEVEFLCILRGTCSEHISVIKDRSKLSFISFFLTGIVIVLNAVLPSFQRRFGVS